jgi:Zn-dependent M28 family amino/carboxypeptidase
MPPQITMAAEDFNRLARMVQQGESLKMAIDLQVQFHTEDPMAYNTVAEIPGDDLKDEIVMLGGHLDSWHAGTGATDNGAGVAATMEAVRILRTLGLRPRRTIRIALWTGEEQGIFGSKGYVKEHFGYYPESEDTNRPGRESRGRRRDTGPTTRPSEPTTRAAPVLVRRDEYDRLSGYFNLDNGTGKIRGVYMEGNEAVRPIFRRWLAPFADMGAQTLTLSHTGGTDHTPFDAVGLPAFQFIQDPIDYWSRTHHSNADVYDRLQAEDLKQASVILATFAYNAAMADEKLPRKPLKDAGPPAPGKPQEPPK